MISSMHHFIVISVISVISNAFFVPSVGKNESHPR